MRIRRADARRDDSPPSHTLAAPYRWLLCTALVVLAAMAPAGVHATFENPDSAMDFVGYINARPFQQSESFPRARFLNVGTSVAFGRQDQAPVPVAFRIGAGSPDANIPGAATVPFLILDLVVSSVTISMGMMMLPPVMISLPLKLLLFVLVDGWTLVVGMLLESFGAG